MVGSPGSLPGIGERDMIGQLGASEVICEARKGIKTAALLAQDAQLPGSGDGGEV